MVHGTTPKPLARSRIQPGPVHLYLRPHARVAELVDAADSKSAALKSVSVRLRPRADPPSQVPPWRWCSATSRSVARQGPAETDQQRQAMFGAHPPQRCCNAPTGARTTPAPAHARGEPMLIIFGWAYGSAPGSIRIVALNSHGTPQILFSAQTFLLTRTVTLHNGRNLEIIGVRSMAQKSGCLETYNPYIVYRLPLPRGTAFTYSEESSRKYNDEHYFRWAGPKATERIAVVLCKRGYGRVLPWTEAERLYNH